MNTPLFGNLQINVMRIQVTHIIRSLHQDSTAFLCIHALTFRPEVSKSTFTPSEQDRHFQQLLVSANTVKHQLVWEGSASLVIG